MSSRIIQIPIPNPYFEGNSNAYALEIGAGKLLLVDTGIGTDEAFSYFRRDLESHGYALKDISVVFLTHKHSDHFGMAHKIREISGARVYVHEDDWNDVAHYTERRDEVAEMYRKTMLFWGISPEAVQMFSVMRQNFDALAHSVSAEKLRDGQKLKIGNSEFAVIHTPGHTQGSGCFLYGEKIFTGDHLLPNYTPNIGATDITVGKMLSKFLKSLEKIRPYSEREALPGHGTSMQNFAARIDTIVQHHHERQEKILRILTDRKLHTIVEIAMALFGTMREHHLLLGCGEVHAHLEMLQEKDCVEWREENRFVRVD